MGSQGIISGDDVVAILVQEPHDRDAAAAIARASGAQIGDPARASVVIVDEWTAEHDPSVRRAHADGCRVTTLAELIIQRLPGPWVGVTGTAGKTSTCHALAHILQATGRHPVMSHSARSANAWPDASVAGRVLGPDEVLIAELTSTHLCHMPGALRPRVAVVTMLGVDHADLHPSHDAYLNAKRRLWQHMGPGSALVAPTDDAATSERIGPAPLRRWGFGDADTGGPGAFAVGPGAVVLRDHAHVVPASLPGSSRVAMRAAMAASAAAMAYGVSSVDVAAVLPTTPAAPHRQHVAGRFRGALIVDDTMAATPLKALAAIEEHAAANPVLVLGGDGTSPEGHDLARVLETVRQSGLRVVAFGAAGSALAGHLDVISEAPTVMGALATAATIAGEGGLVLVSPMFPMDPAERDRVAALPQG